MRRLLPYPDFSGFTIRLSPVYPLGKAGLYASSTSRIFSDSALIVKGF